jgi:hypothetical protein
LVDRSRYPPPSTLKSSRTPGMTTTGPTPPVPGTPRPLFGSSFSATASSASTSAATSPACGRFVRCRPVSNLTFCSQGFGSNT